MKKILLFVLLEGKRPDWKNLRESLDKQTLFDFLTQNRIAVTQTFSLMKRELLSPLTTNLPFSIWHRQSPLSK